MGIRHAQALVILRTEWGDIYRFSLFTTSYDKTAGYKKILSNPQRQSFLLWKGEKVRTAEIQFQDPVKNFKDLIDRFKIEVVRDKFFNNYLELYIQLYREIIKDSEFKKNLEWEKIDIVSFTKTLLWKIIFLYFIQKKWWLWVEKNGKWWEWNKDFMRWLWDNRSHITFEKTGNFYNDCLEHLFYDGLNSPSRIYNDDYDLNFQCKIPYLNGGLFKADYDFEKFEAKILNDIFSNREKTGILDVFDTYNFTIDEDDLYDKEVAIDPEMLWKIFEKMIAIDSWNIDKILTIYEEKKKKAKNWYINMDIENWNVGNNNKKLGAFYTPREIVHYMTRESLIAYLVNNLKWKKEENEEKIRKLFDLKEQFLVSKQEITEEIFDKLTSIVTEVDELLKKVKILDPAIGSGAFPMGLLHEISSIRYYIYWAFYETFEKNAKDFKTPPLSPPQWGGQSSDSETRGSKVSIYKIKRDVIQNNIYGVDISAGAIDIARLRFWLSLVVDEEIPEPLPNFEFKFVCANTLIPLEEEEKQQKINTDSQREINTETLRKYMVSYYNAEKNKDKEEWKVKIEKFLWIGKNLTLDLHNTKSARTKQLETYRPFDPRHSAGFFDPSLMMWNSKFDIVIGNPPYIKEYDNRNAFDWLRDKPYYIWKMDLWYYFACYWLDLLKDWWIQSFIAQNNWITSFGAKIMRNKLLEDAKIKEFIDFWDFKVFENVWIQTMIYILEKTKTNSKYEVKYSRIESKDFDRKNIDHFLYDKKDSDNYKKHYSKIEKSKYLDKTLDFVDDEKDSILEKVFSCWNFRLAEKEVAQWIIWWPDEAFIYTKSSPFSSFEKQFIHDYYTNVWKYYKEDTWRYISYLTKNNVSELTIDAPNFLNNINKFKDNLLNRRECLSGQIKHFHLHWPRDEEFFKKWEKIVCWTRVSCPSFYYTENEYYWSRALNFIKTDRINLKYLTLLLNSNLSFFWLKNKWKLLWDLLQVDKSHLLNIPIKQISSEEQKPFIEKVDKILEITKQSFYDPKNPPKEQKDLESEIDKMVYELYGLSDEEVRVVEESLG